MISEQSLVIASISAIVLVSVLTKVRIISKKYFQTLFNFIFFAYIYICFQYDYMGIMKVGAALYGGVILICWIMEIMGKKNDI